MRVAVSGAGGRLGRAVIAALAGAVDATGSPGGAVPIGWDLPDHDLDDPTSAERLVARDRPDVVVHCAAWTDVDGCARQPDLALRRNGEATGEMARACLGNGTGLVLVSTNEVFDGRRTDGRPYGPGDAVNPINPYGASKLAGELVAQAAFGEGALPGDDREAGADGGPQLGIVRTAWLFGPPGADFPAKILAAAGRARAAGEPLQLVVDEVGSPTYSADLAAAIAALVVGGRFDGTWHVVNGGIASRADVGREVLRLAGLDVPVLEVPASTWPRPSTPPAWAPLDPTPLPSGQLLRDWREALAEYVPSLASAGAR